MPDFFNVSGGGTAQNNAGQTVGTFLGSVAGSFTLFGIQFAVFYLLKTKFIRIYRPKTYLVPEKDRTQPPPTGIFRWALPVFSTPNAELIAKCGLDAYFFLRYLRLLLKIFVPSAFLILVILVPINATQPKKVGVSGLDKLGWQNYDPRNTDRLWAHLVLAIFFIIFICYTVYDELRGYIRVRQAYLTSPQHRLRASATTVLVTSIPHKWLTYEALDGLYDVFPGGIRNIWINRNFDELNDKVKLRNKLALKLESAETSLIRKAKEAQVERGKKEAKKAGKKTSKQEKEKQRQDVDDAAVQMSEGAGLSSGNPHQAHTLEEELGEVSRPSSSSSSTHEEEEAPSQPGILGRSVGVIGQGLRGVGLGFTKLGRNLVREVTGGAQTGPEGTEPGTGTAVARTDGVDNTPMALEQPSHEPGDTSVNRELSPENGETLPGNESNGDVERTAREESWATAPAGAEEGVAVQDQAEKRTPRSSRNTPLHDSSLHHVPEASAPTKEASSNITRENTKTDARPGRIDWTQNNFLVEPEKRGWKIWRDSHGIALPSPEPHTKDEPEYINRERKPGSIDTEQGNTKLSRSRLLGLFSSSNEADKVEDYPVAINEKFDIDEGFEKEAEWKLYVKAGDRDSMRLPAFGWSWMPFMPSWTFIGKKVDTIYYCRKEVARLNVEIEKDQSEPWKYPLMNSAFIQFNHQVAAHMACQSVSHHLPSVMAPRHVEISPGDVIWDNLSIIWWERFLRIGLTTAFVVGLVIAWAIPVSFSTILSNLAYLTQYSAFTWINSIPRWLLSGIQGILPWVFLASLLALLPLILRFTAKLQGVPTGTAVELTVQSYYFGFLFVQLFLVVTVVGSIWKIIGEISKNPASTVTILASSIPKSSNYFFSYMLLQALSVSASSLAQVATLALWFLWRPIVDSTARQKFKRQLNLQSIRWGTFFPVYTNLAVIGIIYSVISPLIMLFNIITFALFWIVYRYQILYVSDFKFDTGGLLFPTACNQLFTGVYTLELALIGLYFLVRDEQDKVSCIPQAVIMIVVLCCTILYHVLINHTMHPLYRYMPITLEDDAVRRDEEFERAQLARWQEYEDEDAAAEAAAKPAVAESNDEDIEDRLERQEQEELDQDRANQEIELQNIASRKSQQPTRVTTRIAHGAAARLTGFGRTGHSMKSWADRSRNKRASGHDSSLSQAEEDAATTPTSPTQPAALGPRKPSGSSAPRPRRRGPRRFTAPLAPPNLHLGATLGLDKLEASVGTTGGGLSRTPKAVGDALFGSFSEQLEDLTAEERDRLLQRAFQHEALRARRPVIWIPRDDLGVSDDEIRRTRAFSDKSIWISNEFTGLDSKGRVMFSRAPPDFSELDLIEL